MHQGAVVPDRGIANFPYMLKRSGSLEGKLGQLGEKLLGTFRGQAGYAVSVAADHQGGASGFRVVFCQ